MSAVLLHLDGVSRTFTGGAAGAEVPAARGVDLRLDEGQVVAVVGESGAGKTTVGRIALGLERVDAGSVVYSGTDITRLGDRRLRRLRRSMHLIFQDPYQSLHPGMRVGDLVAEPLTIAGVPRRERALRAREALAEVDLTPPEDYARRHPHQLSGGQRQRVALARAVVADPRMIVADEPTSMLDVSVRRGILDLLLQMRDDHGIAMIFITHDLAVARYVADCIAVMVRGRLVECGPAEQVVAEPAHPYTRTLLEAVEQVVAPPGQTGSAEDAPCPVCGDRHPAWQVCALPERLPMVEVSPGHLVAWPART